MTPSPQHPSLTKSGRGNCVDINLLIADLLVALPVGRWLGQDRTLTAMAPGDFVHALHNTWLEALPTGWGALQKRRDWDMGKAEQLWNHIYTYSIKITARTEACSRSVAKYGAEDSTLSILIDKRPFIKLLHLSISILHLPECCMQKNSPNMGLSFCVDSFHPESTHTRCLSECPWGSKRAEVQFFPSAAKMQSWKMTTAEHCPGASLFMRDTVELVALVQTPSPRLWLSDKVTSTDQMTTARHWYQVTKDYSRGSQLLLHAQTHREALLQYVGEHIRYSSIHSSFPANCLALVCPPGSNCKLYFVSFGFY